MDARVKNPWPTTAARYEGKVDTDVYAPAVDAVSALLNERGLAFQFGGVAAVVEPQASAVFRDPADARKAAVTTQVVRASPDSLRRAVEAVSRWTRYDARAKKRVAKPVPLWVLQQIVAEGGAGLAPLAGVADHPVFHDGELLAGRIGYHRPTRLYIDCAPCVARALAVSPGRAALPSRSLAQAVPFSHR